MRLSSVDHLLTAFKFKSKFKLADDFVEDSVLLYSGMLSLLNNASKFCIRFDFNDFVVRNKIIIDAHCSVFMQKC